MKEYQETCPTIKNAHSGVSLLIVSMATRTARSKLPAHLLMTVYHPASHPQHHRAKQISTSLPVPQYPLHTSSLALVSRLTSIEIRKLSSVRPTSISFLSSSFTTTADYDYYTSSLMIVQSLEDILGNVNDPAACACLVLLAQEHTTTYDNRYTAKLQKSFSSSFANLLRMMKRTNKRPSSGQYVLYPPYIGGIAPHQAIKQSP